MKDKIINWVELKERFGEEKLIKEIVQAWFVDNPGRIEALAKAIKAKDVEEVQFLSHALKGSAATIGAKLLSQLASQLNFEADSDGFMFISPPKWGVNDNGVVGYGRFT